VETALSLQPAHLFKLAFDRFAAEFAAVDRVAKVEAIEQLNQALLEARTGVGLIPAQPTNASRPKHILLDEH
jgi:hypothetical protein